jgi:hypothetical protein
MLFVNGTWYGDTDNVQYRDEIKALTGVSDTVLDEFYDTSVEGSFGNTL